MFTTGVLRGTGSALIRDVMDGWCTIKLILSLQIVLIIMFGIYCSLVQEQGQLLFEDLRFNYRKLIKLPT